MRNYGLVAAAFSAAIGSMAMNERPQRTMTVREREQRDIEEYRAMRKREAWERERAVMADTERTQAEAIDVWNKAVEAKKAAKLARKHG